MQSLLTPEDRARVFRSIYNYVKDEELSASG